MLVCTDSLENPSGAIILFCTVMVAVGSMTTEESEAEAPLGIGTTDGSETALPAAQVARTTIMLRTRRNPSIVQNSVSRQSRSS